MIFVRSLCTTLITTFQVQLICEARNSNPAAKITWWKQGLLLNSSSNSTIVSATDNGGFTSKLAYSLNVTSDDDGSTYSCQASNEAVQQSVHDSIVLGILYKPVFVDSDPLIVEAKEGGSLLINVTARANPDAVTYQWFKGNESIWTESPIVNLTSVERTLSGTYRCHATNEIGGSFLTVILKILFPATIIKRDEEREGKFVVAEPRSNQKLTCEADGYPLPEDVIKWKRGESFDMDSSKTELLATVNGKSTLIVKNVSQQLSEEFTCLADNGVGEVDEWKIFLLVKNEPVMVESDSYSSVLSDRGRPAKLLCKAEGVPDVTFAWSFQGTTVSDGQSRIKHEVARLDAVTWQSTLSIEDVEAKDFGDYICIARNEIGFNTTLVAFLPDGSPDPPLLLKAINSTKHALQLAWVPGFDGGHNQSYRIRFKSSKDPAFSYFDVHPPDSNSTWVQGLNLNTEYEFAIKAINTKGASAYTTDAVKVKTLGLSDEDRKLLEDSSGFTFSGTLTEILIAAIITVLFLLLAFNMILLALYYKKKPKGLKKASYLSSEMSSSFAEASEETTFSEEISPTTSSPSSPDLTYDKSSDYESSSEEQFASREEESSSQFVFGEFV